jgi:hypothetical protein
VGLGNAADGANLVTLVGRLPRGAYKLVLVVDSAAQNARGRGLTFSYRAR